MTMEALKVWSSRPLRRLFHLASPSPPTSKSYLPVAFIRCCSSSSSTSAAACISAAVPKQSDRSRRSSVASITTSTSDRESIRTIRLKKVEELRSKGFEHYAYKWDKSHTANQLLEMYKHLGNGEELNGENDQVSVSGRIVARRAFGKHALLTLRDDSGTILPTGYLWPELFFSPRERVSVCKDAVNRRAGSGDRSSATVAFYNGQGHRTGFMMHEYMTLNFHHVQQYANDVTTSNPPIFPS